MRIERYILLSLACWLLQSCAFLGDTQRLQSGKVSFMAGDFKSAFHQLLPLAAAGIPQAEYGVGYMYYYGYGVTQDNESGIFWMNKAANAHYVPAIRALAAIQENTIKQEETRRYSSEATLIPATTRQAENNSPGKDALLETLTNPPRPGHVALLPPPDEIPSAPNKTPVAEKMNNYPAATPFASAAAKKYTLQLLGSYYLSSLKQRQATLNLGVPTHIGQTKHNGRDWYVLTYGHYSALGHAELARFDLPKKIKDFNPWIRKCDELEWIS